MISKHVLKTLQIKTKTKKKLPQRISVRFVNRKISDEAFVNRKKLKGLNKREFGFDDSTKLFINDKWET